MSQFTFVFEIGPHLGALFTRYLDLLENPMTIDELKAYADSKATEVVASLTATAQAETAEVVAAIAAAGKAGGLTDAEIKASIDDHSASLKDQVTTLITGIFNNPTSTA